MFFTKSTCSGPKEELYPGLFYCSSELSAFTTVFELFLLALKNKEIIQFVPNDRNHFLEWLLQHQIRNINEGR